MQSDNKKKDFRIGSKGKQPLNQRPEMQGPTKQEQIRFMSLDRAVQAHSTNREVRIVELAKEIETYLNSPFDGKADV